MSRRTWGRDQGLPPYARIRRTPGSIRRATRRPRHRGSRRRPPAASSLGVSIGSAWAPADPCPANTVPALHIGGVRREIALASPRAPRVPGSTLPGRALARSVWGKFSPGAKALFSLLMDEPGRKVSGKDLASTLDIPNGASGVAGVLAWPARHCAAVNRVGPWRWEYRPGRRITGRGGSVAGSPQRR
jgi:hypothetical protein